MGSSSRKVLLVDDDALVRGVIVDILTELGFAVVEAQNGAEAVACLADHPDLNLLITDILMPGMDGWTLAETIRDIRPSIPVVYVTGYYAEDARPVRGACVVKKPFGAKELAKTVARVI